MSEVPSNLRFTETHEWVMQDEEGNLVVGITDYAQTLLGDIVYIELPDAGDVIGAAEDCAVVESVKAASDIYCPVSGQIADTNEALNGTPEVVNSSPYQEGWLFKLTPDNPEDMEELLTAEQYQKQVAEEAH